MNTSATNLTSPDVVAFDHEHPVAARELASVLGGKGAGLAEMTRLGIDVPPGFTLTIPVCRRYQEVGWTDEMEASVVKHVQRLGKVMGRRFGDSGDPLLVAVRSGAARSMPGMLDTVLNLGLNAELAGGLARVTGDETFAWSTYERFVRSYATVVMGLSAEILGAEAAIEEAGRTHVEELLAHIERVAGRPVPGDPNTQLREAVAAVFKSWGSARARAYRHHEGMPDDGGTAVSIQAMVFGNRGPRSGTGVAFTRDPSTGAHVTYGDYLPQAQGDDVVAGTHATMSIVALRDHLPEVHERLAATLRRLEVHYRDMCDVEFTVEDGRLWILQTRIGRRSAISAVRVAVELVEDPDINLTPEEAAGRLSSEILARASADRLAALASQGAPAPLVAGLGASAGRASGRAVFTSEAAMDAEDPVILVRRETSPDDVPGMSVAAGVLTTRGGLVSHAAVIARGWGIPTVVGAAGLRLEGDAAFTDEGPAFVGGDVITIDGTTGGVWLGDHTQLDDTAQPQGEAPHGALDAQLALASEWLATYAEEQTVVEERVGDEPGVTVVLDREKCSALGICEAVAPDYFEVDEEGDLALLRTVVPRDQAALLEKAVASCPTAALSLRRG